MKALTRFILLAFVSVLSMPSTFAAQNELTDDELAEYLIFEAGTWWDYVNSVEYAKDFDTSSINFAETEEEATTRMESLSCNIFRCYTLSAGEIYIDYFIDNGSVYMNKYDGYDTNDLEVLSLEGLSVNPIGEIRGALLGYESMSGYASDLQCEVDVGTYEYKGYQNDALQHLCTYLIEDVQGEETRFVNVEYYLKNLGKVYTETEYYLNGEWQATYSVSLTDTSIDVDDLTDDQSGKNLAETNLDEDVELASDNDELLAQNIEDYVDFDDHTWWEYELNTTNYYDGSSSVSRMVEGSENGLGLEGYVEDNIYYLSGYDGEGFDEPYIGFDLNGYSQDIREDAYLALSIDEETWGDVENVSMECEYSLDESREVEMDNGEAYEDMAIFEECSMEFELVESGVVMEMTIESYYLKGLGNTSFEARVYASGSLLLQISRELISTSLLEDATFSDVDVENKKNPAIDYLYDEEVLAGYEDGSFKPENTVNRAELLKILVEGQGITPDENTYKNCFPDVTTEWYAKYVCYAKEEGWVGGYPDGTFRPADSVNKVEALKMLLNSQEIATETPDEKPFTDVAVDDWFAPYVTTAQKLELLEETGYSFSPDSDRSRAGIAEELYRLLTSL